VSFLFFGSSGGRGEDHSGGLRGGAFAGGWGWGYGCVLGWVKGWGWMGGALVLGDDMGFV